MMEKEKYKNLMNLAKEDPGYQAWLEEVKQLEPIYLTLKEVLPEMQKRVIEKYISADKKVT